MPSKVYSNNAKAKAKRIERLPKYYGNMMMGAIKSNMLGMIETFHDGIKSNDFGLVELKPKTIDRKTKQGFELPMVPLYGKGDDRKRDSYVNMLRITKVINGWKLYISTAMHWSQKIALYDLFIIHEYGCQIQRGETTIRIPPRPAFKLAYQKWMSKRGKDKRETSRNVKEAIRAYIETADMTYINFYTMVLKRRVDSEE